MKRIMLSVTLLLGIASAAFSATLSPVQLLNPAGSTAGQAILSTGTSTPPAWGNVALSGVTGTLAIANGGTGATSASAALTNLGAASIGANTFTAGQTINDTGSSSNTSLVVSATSSSNGANIKMIGNGATTPNKYLRVLNGAFAIVNSGYSGLLLSLDDSGNLATTGKITPNSLAGIGGTTTNDNASAGSVGEYVANNASGVALSNGIQANITSVSLTAGDWDVSGNVTFPCTGTFTVAQNGISTTSATLNTAERTLLQATFGGTQQLATPVSRISIASTTTVFLVGSASFTTSCSASGLIRARRVR